MNKIGGNIDCVLKYQSVTRSAIGEDVSAWVELQTIKGFLDLMTNGKNYDAYNKAVVDSTHVFICDYVSIQTQDENGKERQLQAVINGKTYDVQYIDNPQELNYHLEIFLKKVE